MVIGHVDRQSPHVDDSARADALALAFVDVAERVFPGGLRGGGTTGVDFDREGVMVRVVAMEVPVAHGDIKPENIVDALASGAAITFPGTALAPSTTVTLAPPGPAPEMRERYGRAAFEAYNVAVGGLTWDGKPIPGWEVVTDKVREGWRVAAMAAVDAAVFEGVLP